MPAKPTKRRSAASVPKKKSRGAGGKKAKPDDRELSVIYLHGEGPQAPPSVLKRSWDLALFGKAVGARSFLDYYADILYPEAGVETQASSSPKEAEIVTEKQKRIAAFAKNLAESMRNRAELESRTDQLQMNRTESAVNLQVDRFVGDAVNLLTDEVKRDTIRTRFLQSELIPGTGRYLLVTHGLGGLLAYRGLTDYKGGDITVDLWVSLGTPFGNPGLEPYLGSSIKVPDMVKQWHNFSLHDDPVVLDYDIEAKPKTRFKNWAVTADLPYMRTEQNAHALERYLTLPDVRRVVQEALPSNFTSELVGHIIAHDVAEDINSSPKPLPVLIEIRSGMEGDTLVKKRDKLETAVKSAARNRDDLNIDRMKRYLAADLTGEEIKRLIRRAPKAVISKVWKNSEKQSLLDVSIRTIQAEPARDSYGANGTGITWAVIDSGIAKGHAHFQKHENIKKMFDCTHFESDPEPPPETEKAWDSDGHGTHVAAIIAGEGEHGGKPLRAIAPQAELHIYKALRDGRGRDSWIIKALDHIGNVNDESAELRIHGVNLSLGGPFDVEVFGCGHSPVCRELRRLWRQGVVVCIAAGNSGRIEIKSGSLVQNVNLDLSIGDPANLEEAIAVGSVHKSSPHRYGISHFSSRGPTADGRLKPDLVAPGEKILSANAGTVGTTGGQYIVKSGTSQACPHISGLIAAFLSVRREFIGYPDKVKEILLENCTDLGRERYHQGAGMPNLIKMMANT